MNASPVKNRPGKLRHLCFPIEHLAVRVNGNVDFSVAAQKGHPGASENGWGGLKRTPGVRGVLEEILTEKQTDSLQIHGYRPHAN